MLSPEAAFMLLDILKDTPPPGGSVTWDTLPLPVYWKTGTSGGLRDAWSVGLFGHYALAVWVGDFRGSTRGNYVGITQAAPLFFDLMGLVVASQQPTDMLLSKAAGLKLVKARACADTGDIDLSYCTANVPVWLIPGVSPTKPSGIYRSVLVNRKTDRLACTFVAGVTDYRVEQFWPSDIAQVFAEAGIHKPAPPAWEEGCSQFTTTVASLSPRIISPARSTRYTVREGADNRLQLKARLDGHVRFVFWFVDNIPVARAAPEEPVFVPLTLGTHQVRLVDDTGRADSRVLVVE